MSVLVIAQHDNHTLTPATLSVIQAGRELGQVTVLVAGTDSMAVATCLKTVSGVSAILHTDSPSHKGFTAENMADTIARNGVHFAYILFPANTFGKNIAPRVAALLDTQQISDVIKIESADTFVRPIYADNALATIKSHDSCKVLTIRTTTFDAVKTTGGNAEISNTAHGPELGISAYEGTETVQSDRPDLTTADVVVSGGRALGSKENFALIEDLATVLNGAVGASRAAVDAGYIPNDLQVGQTGKIVAPKLYFAIGVSGAIQHIAGIKDSKTIVAINTDPEAPIFEVADYGIVGDLFEIVPELISALKG